MHARHRICQLITELGDAGAERCVYELATRLDRRRFAPHVAALRGGPYADRLAAAGVPVTVLGMATKADALRLGRLPAVLRRWRIDLLHTHLFHADLAGRLAAAAAGVRHLVHSVHVAEARWRPWQFAFARWARPRAERIVGVSQAVCEHHRQRSGLPAGLYEAIPNGIDVGRYARDPLARQRLRRRWGLDDRDVAVVFCGRLDPQKGLDTFLDALDRLAGPAGSDGASRPADRPPIRALIAGDGPQRGLVTDALARRPLGRCTRYLGFWPDVPGLLSATDLLAMPSRWEGFGLAAAEAMAAELPVVATRVAGLSEVVADGQTGLLVAPEAPAALAAALGELAGDPARRAELGAAGRQRVRTRFTIEANIAAHERLYEDLL